MFKGFENVKSGRALTMSNQNLNDHASSATNRVKCMLIGDAGIGKSALVRSFILSDDLSLKYAPTTWEDYSVHKRMKDVAGMGTQQQQKYKLAICDTGGLKEMDRLRPLCYNKVDVVILCFSVINPSSFKNVSKKWLPEIKRHAADASILLVGTQSDLRCNTQVLLHLSRKGLAPVLESKAMHLVRKIGAKCYIECSAIKNKNVKQVFDYTVTWGLQNIYKKQFDIKPSIQDCKKKRQVLSREWRAKTCSKLKKLLFLSCI